MKKSSALFFVLLTFCKTLLAQTALDVTEQTFKLQAKSGREFYFYFAEGDKILINFQEADNKELKSFEVTELPGTSRLAEYKTAALSNRTLSVSRNSIYRFSFFNSSLAGRICKFSIKRIPAGPATAFHNTSVDSRVEKDSLLFFVSQKYLQSSDTAAISVVDMVAKVAPRASFDKNSHHTIVDFALPAGTVSWAYYIGVGTEGMKAEADARYKFINSSASVLSKFPGYGSMAALALYGINAFDKAQGDDNVRYWFVPDWDNVQKFRAGSRFVHYKQGDVVNDAVQMKSPLSGKVFLALENDNMVQSIDVLVKITAVQLKQKWASRTVQFLSIPNTKAELQAGD